MRRRRKSSRIRHWGNEHENTARTREKTRCDTCSRNDVKDAQKMVQRCRTNFIRCTYVAFVTLLRVGTTKVKTSFFNITKSYPKDTIDWTISCKTDKKDHRPSTYLVLSQSSKTSPFTNISYFNSWNPPSPSSSSPNLTPTPPHSQMPIQTIPKPPKFLHCVQHAL